MPQLVVDQTKEIGTQIALEASVSPDMQNKYEYKLTELKKKKNRLRWDSYLGHPHHTSQPTLLLTKHWTRAVPIEQRRTYGNKNNYLAAFLVLLFLRGL